MVTKTSTVGFVVRALLKSISIPDVSLYPNMPVPTTHNMYYCLTVEEARARKKQSLEGQCYAEYDLKIFKIITNTDVFEEEIL